MEPAMSRLPDTADIKQESLEVKQDCQLKREAISEEDIPQSSATVMKYEYDEEIENTDLALKFEEGSINITSQDIKNEDEWAEIKQEYQLKHEDAEDDNPVVAGTSGVLSSTGNISLQQEHISETDVDLCSYSCDYCKKKFNKLFKLQKHTVIHKEKQSAKLGTESERPNVQGQKNNRSEQIHRHICSICNKSFAQGGTLNRHMKTHTGERPFSCEICNKSFLEHGHLKTHKRTHTGEHPYSCEICNKSFTEHGSLIRHVRTHTGERPFCCRICNSFTQRGHLKRHENSHR